MLHCGIKMEEKESVPSLSDVHEAIRNVVDDLKLPPLKEPQIFTILKLVQKQNVINQLPTGTGKTMPILILPHVMDVLRDQYQYEMSKETRVLYIVPLVNIYQTLVLEMERLNIHYQVMSAGSNSDVDVKAKVVFISPERLVNKSVMNSILELSWSCISIDEPHLAISWGMSKSKKGKPFREAFAKLSNLNSLGTVFELHSATISNIDQLFQFMGRKNSCWSKQIVVPERQNLTYFLLTGDNVPSSVTDLPVISISFASDVEGITLIYVQSIKEGSELFMSILSYCEQMNLVEYPVDRPTPLVPVSFLHSNLTDETKLDILKKALKCEIKVLIATSAAGAGINLPVRRFVGWGLDREPAGIIQSQGRTGRYPFTGEGIVMWVHITKQHGQRVPASSRVRELLQSSCLRKTMNSWFTHDCHQAELETVPEMCCNFCMTKCIQDSECLTCSSKLEAYLPIKGRYSTVNLEVELADLFRNLSLNANLTAPSLHYAEESLASEIVEIFHSSEDKVDITQTLACFGLGPSIIDRVARFLIDKVSHLPSSFSVCDVDTAIESDEYSSTDSGQSEYYDSESEDGM